MCRSIVRTATLVAVLVTGDVWAWMWPPVTTQPPLILSDVCGMRMFTPVNGSDNGDSDDGFLRSIQNESLWPWMAKMDNGATGVLLSKRHVVTLVECLQNYRSWFGGYNNIFVEVGGKQVGVSTVTVQEGHVSTLPLALLRLQEDMPFVVPVCVGHVLEDRVAVAVGWAGRESPHAEVVRFHNSYLCREVHKDYYQENLMVCGEMGPGDCGSGLLQTDEGRWNLVGIGGGDINPAARYVALLPAIDWFIVRE